MAHLGSRQTLSSEKLTEKDLELLARCYITPDLAERAGLFRVDSGEGGRLMGRNGYGDYSGIVFPYRLPGETRVREYRLRRDHPDLEQSGSVIKEKAKYLSPPGSGNRFYFPPDVNPGWLKDPGIPVLFIEGEKKSLALSRAGLGDAPAFIPIGLAGVWGWRGVVGKGPDAKGARSDIKGPIPDFDLLEWQDRIVYLMFDANARTNEKVKAACSALKTELKKRRAAVHLVDLPEIEGVNGPDDLLGLKGPEFVLDLISSASTSNAAFTPSQWLNHKFPGLASVYGDAVLEELDKHDVTSVHGINEDFLAATLGEQGTPDAPTVFMPAEGRFFTYSHREGIFVLQREAFLLARLSSLLLACARACKGNGCETQALEFRFREHAKLVPAIRKAKGLLEVAADHFATDLTKRILCENGVLRLSDNSLQPFSPTYKSRNKLAVRFDPAARCPLFLNTLMRPALDHDELDLIQRWCGLALIGENLAQKILILIGTPGGGKGAFVRVLTGIIGPINLASLRPQLLGERFELSRFLGKTLLYGADVNEKFLNERGASVLKSLTGYDPMTLEFKNSNESPFVICRFNVIVTCNSRLTVHLEGDTDAWRRRLVIVNYEKEKPRKVIADLDQQILATEGSGVLNWMLEGLAKLRADGWQLRLTAKQQSAVDNLLLESDGHALFIKDELVRSDAHLTVQEAFSAYVEYCSERGWMTLARNTFGRLIGDAVARQHGLTVRHDISDASGKAQRGWQGLALRQKHRLNPLPDEIYFPPGSGEAQEVSV